ncbi:MAG: UDP-N-acetylglucosamine--N-acetylmuramyl-(pentapeptide) pyrophosphoryl-undecaprenol N-acetylglucosamine transferase [Kiritimatiellae bacterium]|nr:UDP-N-acetylglucosamine--N-acetylmuramyl-(pentapeptide) pyrophosphoryl-undecaprenol N-acetylglucosamine transferase [Kiritimatiellia bacterium]
MKIIVACGGTGGHAFPGIAVADELRKRGHEVVVWDSGRDVESSVMKNWAGPVFSTGARQLAAKNAFGILRSILRCRVEMRRARPDAMLAMGSYSSLPPVLAARMCGVKVYLHEANTVPGKAVEFLSRFAEAVAISFNTTVRYLGGVRTVLTGLPVRAEIAAGRRFDFIPADAFVVFVTGGSQGAHAVNELMSAALPMLGRELAKRGGSRPLYVIHQTGVKDESAVKVAYAEASLPSRVHAFENEMADAFASADIVVARAGASTCFELAACGKPALLIPLPSALRDHQHFNANAFASKGAADEGSQAVLSARQVCRYLLEKYLNSAHLARMSERMKALAAPDAAAKVADMVEGKMV